MGGRCQLSGGESTLHGCVQCAVHVELEKYSPSGHDLYSNTPNGSRQIIYSIHGGHTKTVQRTTRHARHTKRKTKKKGVKTVDCDLVRNTPFH
jgi:hypothetical protein